MVVLSPLLHLAGFYQPPFAIETETSIEIAAEDEGEIVKGNIDVLLMQQCFWILVIESKQAKFDVMTAVPQALVYMLHAPDSQQQTWGMLVNGREFVFIKLVQKENPQYCHSYALPIERPQEFHEVLSLLKYLGQIVNTEN